MEDYKGDKRSKEYRQWKKNLKEASNGLGDKVEKVFKATGIDKAAKFILGEDCGCDERKKALNTYFPHRKINCLTEYEYNYLADYFENSPNVINSGKQNDLILIYNTVFDDRASPTSCGSCFLNGVHAKLKKVFNEYND